MSTSIFSMAFPITFLKSTIKSNLIDEPKAQHLRKMYKKITYCGTAILLVSFWTVYALVVYRIIPYPSDILVRRELINFLTISTTALGIISVLSTVSLTGSSTKTDRCLPIQCCSWLKRFRVECKKKSSAIPSFAKH